MRSNHPHAAPPLALAVPLAAAAQAARSRSSTSSSCPAAAPPPAPTSTTASSSPSRRSTRPAASSAARSTCTSLDTQTNPGVAKALAQKAVDDGAYVVMGPVFSGSIIVSMAETKKRRDPELHRRRGGQHHAAGQPVHLPHVVHAVDGDAQAGDATSRTRSRRRSVAIIYVNNDFGKGGRDVMVKALEAQGIKVAADISTDPGQVDFSGAVLKAKQSNADALFVYTNEEESARALRELRKQGYDKPIVGETTLTGQKVIELAGDAANGAIAHVGLTADAPQPAIKAFDEKFQKEYKYKSDHNGMKGYSAMYVVKAITEKNGKVDSKAARQGAARREDLGEGQSGRAARRDVRRQRRPRPRELPGQGRQRQAGGDRRRCRRLRRSSAPPQHRGESAGAPAAGRPAERRSRRRHRDGRLHPARLFRHRDRRDLRARGAGLHAAVAGGGRHQLRARRVRDAAGVRRCCSSWRWARRCGSRSC